MTQTMINKRTFRQKLASYKRKPGSLLLLVLVSLSALITAALVISLVVYILVKGIPNLNAGLFAWEYSTENSSMMPALINTLIITLLSLLIAGPIGIFSAIYMTEYAKKGNKLVGVVRTTTETLAGIPSIVYGLFGQLFFVLACGFDYSMLAGALTMSIMVLPTITPIGRAALDLARAGSELFSVLFCPRQFPAFWPESFFRSAESWEKRQRSSIPPERLLGSRKASWARGEHWRYTCMRF